MVFGKGKCGHQLKEKIEERRLTSTVEPCCPLLEKILAGASQLTAQGQGRLHMNAWIFHLTKLNDVSSNCAICSAISLLSYI